MNVPGSPHAVPCEAGHVGCPEGCPTPPRETTGLHGEGFGTGLPNDADYADVELRYLALLPAPIEKCSCQPRTLSVSATCPTHGKGKGS